MQIFQQVGIIAHLGQGNKELLMELFPHNLLYRATDFSYPPRSPDLSICDTLLWGTPKENCFRPAPHSIQELKQNVTSVLMDYTTQECSGMVTNMLRRMDCVINNAGTHVEHLVLR